MRDSDFSSGLFYNFVAIHLTFVQFILQLKSRLCVIVHLVLEEFKNFSQVIIKCVHQVIMSHGKSQSQIWSLISGPESGVGVRVF